MSSWPLSRKKVFNVLSRKCDQFEIAYPSIDTIAKESGVCVSSAKESLSILEDYGLIGILRRPNKTSLYKLSSFFCATMRSRLASIFTSFLKVSLVAFIACNLSTSAECLRYINKDIKELRKVLNKWGGMKGIPLIDLMYKDSPIPPHIRELEIFNLEQQLELTAFDYKVIKRVKDAYDRHKDDIDDPYNWFWSTCNNLSKKLGLRPNFVWSRYLGSMIDLFRQVEIDNKSKKELEKKTQVSDKSVRTEFTAIAAQSYDKDSRLKESLKREGIRTHIEWQCHPIVKEIKKPTVSLEETIKKLENDNNPISKALLQFYRNKILKA